MCQWLDGFVNAGECSALLDWAKTKLSARKAEVPNLLIKEDFQGKETSTERVREAFTGLQSVNNVLNVLKELEDTAAQCLVQGQGSATVVESAHMVFAGPSWTRKIAIARRMGVRLLPRAHVEVTAANLWSQSYIVGMSSPRPSIFRPVPFPFPRR